MILGLPVKNKIVAFGEEINCQVYTGHDLTTFEIWIQRENHFAILPMRFTCTIVVNLGYL